MSDAQFAVRLARELGHARKVQSGTPQLAAPLESRKVTKLHTGPIHSVVAGRTDHLPVHVPSGSFVLPADIISGMGEGNTDNGFRVAKRIFGGTPYSGGGLPYGANSGPYGSQLPKADGGEASSGAPVAVVVAGGEHILSPEEVAKVGDGDMALGHKVLDEFVNRYRAKTIKTLKALPPTKKD